MTFLANSETNTCLHGNVLLSSKQPMYHEGILVSKIDLRPTTTGEHPTNSFSSITCVCVSPRVCAIQPDWVLLIIISGFSFHRTVKMWFT